MSYDAELHHIGLGEDIDSLEGYQLIGPYLKQLAAPVFDRPSDIGTDDLTGQRSFSTWTQGDYSGGEFQRDWGDVAMFWECLGMLPDQLSKAVRSVAPLSAANIEFDAVTPHNVLDMTVMDGTIFITYNSDAPRGTVTSINPSSYGSERIERVPTADLPTDDLITSVFWNLTTSRIWIGTNTPKVLIYEYDFNQATGSGLVLANNLDAPSLASDPVVQINGIHLFGKIKIVVTGHGGGDLDNNRVWIHVSGTGADSKWTQIGTLPGAYITSTTYNNAIYILSRTGDSQTQLSMTQGDEVFPVLDLPYYFRGRSMVEYAGRLYIFGVGQDIDGNDNHGELFEVNGTSLRLVRTFAPEVQRAEPSSVTGEMETTAPGTVPEYRKRVMKNTQAIAVAEGLLWMPDSSSTGLEVYDATSDGFFGGPRLRTGNDTDLEFVHIVSLGDSLFLWGDSITDDETKIGLYRTERKADDGEAYVAYLTTSDFHPEPGRDKVWSRFSTLTRNHAPTLDYSVDSGDTWTAVSATATTTAGDRVSRDFDLSALPQARAIRFRIKFALNGDADELPAFLVAHSLSFLVKGDGKKRWQFTVNGALAVESLEEGTIEQTPTALWDALWALRDLGATVTFKDVDGATYEVVVTDIQQQSGFISGDLEGHVALTLLEV